MELRFTAFLTLLSLGFGQAFDACDEQLTALLVGIDAGEGWALISRTLFKKN